MPGLVEAHFHPTYFNVAALEDLDIKYPVEYVTLLAASNAKLALECGYTAARSGGSLFIGTGNGERLNRWRVDRGFATISDVDNVSHSLRVGPQPLCTRYPHP